MTERHLTSSVHFCFASCALQTDAPSHFAAMRANLQQKSVKCNCKANVRQAATVKVPTKLSARSIENLPCSHLKVAGVKKQSCHA